MNVTIESIKKFILAGNAFFTVKNDNTGKHITFNVSKVEDKDLWFVSTLTGADNTNDYTYMGVINGNGFRPTKKSKISTDAVSFKGFNWLWNQVSSKTELPENVKFFHAGRCGRCGRTLTTPESVEMGFGPICMEKLG